MCYIGPKTFFPLGAVKALGAKPLVLSSLLGPKNLFFVGPM